MYYFIVNPKAGYGRGEDVWLKVEKELKREGIEYQAYMTEKPGDARAFAKDLTEGCKESHMIVAVGGDGTVNEILDGLSFCGSVTFGYIAAGSGNDLARSLKLPKSPRKCLNKILHPRYYVMVDYGVLSYGEDGITCRRFMVSAGIGMDAAVCHNILYSGTRGLLARFHLTRISYLLIGVKQLFLAKPVKGYLLLDGVRKVEFNHMYFISAHIHPFEGGGFKFAPDAEYDDGKLSICLMNNRKKRKLISVLVSSLLGRRPRNKGVRYYTCEEAAIHLDKPMALHVDGESCLSQNELEVRCVSQTLRMIV